MDEICKIDCPFIGLWVSSLADRLSSLSTDVSLPAVEINAFLWIIMGLEMK